MNDMRPRPGDIPAALALLSRLPLPWGGRARAGGVWAYPLAGAVLGGLAGAVAALALWLGIPAPLAALLTLTAAVAMTGALHEDGLADVADGFWGGWTRDRRLEIMRDSRIGSYGVAALALSLAARWQALALVLAAGGPWGGIAALVAAGALGRGAMPVLMAALPHARADGLSRSVGRPSWGVTGLGLMLSFAVAVLVLPLAAAVMAWLVAAIAALGMGLLARAKIGGQTGDTLGATQQMAEIAVLILLATLTN